MLIKHCQVAGVAGLVQRSVIMHIAGTIPQLLMVSDKWNLYLCAIFGSLQVPHVCEGLSQV